MIGILNMALIGTIALTTYSFTHMSREALTSPSVYSVLCAEDCDSSKVIYTPCLQQAYDLVTDKCLRNKEKSWVHASLTHTLTITTWGCGSIGMKRCFCCCFNNRILDRDSGEWEYWIKERDNGTSWEPATHFKRWEVRGGGFDLSVWKQSSGARFLPFPSPSLGLIRGR